MQAKLEKPIVLVGLMGCGKSAIGTRLAEKLGVKFYDTDTEVEAAEGMAVSEIFAKHGEPYFRQKEKETVLRLLASDPAIIASGGGMYMNPEVRAEVAQKGISVWINGSLEILLERVSRKNTRPLLEGGDKASILENLMQERNPIYAEADIHVETTDGPHEVVVERIIDAI